MSSEETTIRQMIKEIMETFDRRVTKQQILEKINDQYSNVNERSVSAHLYSLSVNYPSRINHGRNHKPRSFNPDYDFLFRVDTNNFELYDPRKHGNYELMESNGKTVVAKDGIPILNNEKSSLLEFLQNPRRTYANYQPIVIKILLEKGKEQEFSSQLKEIEEKIIQLNFDREDFKIKNAMDAVLPALEEYVESDGETISLKIDVFSDEEISECLKICGQEIAKWHIEKILKQDFDVWSILPGSSNENFPYLDEFIKTNSVGIGWDKIRDISNLSESEIKEKFVEQYEGDGGWQGFLDFTKIKQKDIIVLTKGQQEITDFGIVVGDYEFKDVKDPSYAHRKQVVWLNQGPIPAEELPNPTLAGFMTTCSRLVKRKQEMISVLLGENTVIENDNYFMVRHNIGSGWDDEKGRKYNFGKTVPNQKKLREAGIGTKTIWYTKENGEYYFWGYGTVKEIQVVEKDTKWSLVYGDFRFFEKQEDSLEIEGQFLKHGNEFVKDKIENVENFNVQNSMFKITKKIYEDITGDEIIMNPVEPKKENYQKFFNILNKKKQFYFYGPPGTGKTFTAKKIAREFIKESQTKLSSDEQYNEYVLSMINKVSHENGFKLEKQTNNQIILKNTQKEIRIYLNYSKSGKETPHDCYVGISQTVIDFLDQTDEENRFILIVNNDVKNFVSIPHQFIKQNLKLSGGENWDSSGNGDHAFHIHVHNNTSQFRTNDNYSQNYEDCSNFSSNLEILFESKGKPCNKLEKITFHQSFSYEEFIEGIRPKTDEKINQITYPVEDGIFKRLSKCASLHDKENFVLIIDEINRGNISKIFGELITLLENDKRGDEITLPYSKKLFSVPENLYIIGTMNTADRSLVHIDAALKRRFGQYELMPNYSIIDAKIDKIHLGKLLENINQKIINAGFRDNQIGHSYFMSDGNPITTPEELQFAFAYDIVPLLKDNFYDDNKILKDILGDEFIDENGDTISEWMEDVSIFMKTIESAYHDAVE
jgi:Cdc6-like AAA superfamily ATPase